MKYIKLYENFDRYEFGKFNNEGSNLINKHEEILNNRVEFIKNEIDIIIEYLSNREIEYDRNEISILAILDNTETLYDIYSLGDYCYAMVEYELYNISQNIIKEISIYDGIDDLLEDLKLINEEE